MRLSKLSPRMRYLIVLAILIVALVSCFYLTQAMTATLDIHDTNNVTHGQSSRPPVGAIITITMYAVDSD